MRNDRSPDNPRNTDITLEMRMLFTALGIERVKCYECQRGNFVEAMIWSNECMWFICPTCKRAEPAGE